MLTAKSARFHFALPRLRWKPKLWHGLLLLALGLVVGEVSRCLSVWFSLQKAARWGVRYAVTLSFDNQYCDEAVAFYQTHTATGAPGAGYLSNADTLDLSACRVQPNAAFNNDYWIKTAAVQDLARLLTTYDQAASVAPAILTQAATAAQAPFIYPAGSVAARSAAAAGQAARLTVCSTRAGYDPERMFCLPRDDAGGEGDRVVVGVEYAYPVAGWLGVPITYLPLRVTQEGSVESSLLSQEVVLPPGALSDSESEVSAATPSLAD